MPNIKKKKKLYIKTYGCQMNVYDSERMADLLKPLGFIITELPEDADMVILNTCHIREKASEKVYSELGRIREYKEAKRLKDQNMVIAVAGCTAQAEGEEILRRAKYVDVIVGPQSYYRLPQILAEIERKTVVGEGPGRGILEIDFPVESKFDFLPESAEPQSVSAFLSIQEGCDKFCHFCVVPYTRGAEYSRPVETIYEEACRLVEKGVQEITLLGQNVNAYHGTFSDREGWTLGRLIQYLSKIQALKRIRYVTSHPADVNEEQINAHRDIEKLMPYLHLPIQSGSDRILKLMNRKHTASYYLDVIGKLRSARPDIAFSSDFIVGYPGETDKDFEDTLELVAKVNFASAFSFKYSPRPGTPASVLDDQVPEEVKTERLARLQSLLFEQQTAFNQSFIGKSISVLFEKQGRHPGQLMGRSPYLQSVYVEAAPRLIGQCVNILVTHASQNSLTGTVITQEKIAI
ncbi:(dimethylallyl)adenosine tRNA methylthiotransferase [Candidatus Paracaedimonas acanthamoebae]|nr:(dimethylallyl)adenosine tRNA methylthiotransferase [Candidatus Paracaedimonas acanthamoebae]